jgi:amidophosphoribosyltransferase
MAEFVAFEAAISLLKKRGMDGLIDEVYERCVNSLKIPKNENVNEVKAIYAPFTYAEISDEIASIITPINMRTEVAVIYQTLEDLHIACPKNKGDWYFSGDYPTPGGNRVVNRAFMNWVEGKNVRAYFSA